MNVSQMKKVIREKYPEINLVDLGMEKISKLSMNKVFLRDILESDVQESYYLKNKIVEEIIRTKEFGKRFSCLKTKKFSN